MAFTAIGQANPDFNGDGSVGFRDFLLFAVNFGLSRDDAIFDARHNLDGNGGAGPLPPAPQKKLSAVSCQLKPRTE